MPNTANHDQTQQAKLDRVGGKPTYDELRDALGLALAEYAVVDEMLDNFAACGPEGMTRAERKQQQRSNAARDRLKKLFDRTY